MLQVRRNSAEEFRVKSEGQTFLRIVIAGFEGNKPVIFVRQFRTVFISRNVGLMIIPDDCLDDCDGQVATRFLGETDAIDGLPEDTPGFGKDGLVDGVRRLVEIETQARSEYVAPPIDILQITSGGAKWIQKKLECPTLQPLGRRVDAPPRRRRR